MNRLIRSLCLTCAGLLVTGLTQAEILCIGDETFTEQRILTAIIVQSLQKRGYDMTVITGLGNTLARVIQESGQLGIVWEYTSSSLIVYNHIDEKFDAVASYHRVKQLDETQDLVWLKLTHFSNTHALAMPEEQAERLGIQSASDLARVLAGQQEVEPGSTHLFVMDPKFTGRPDGPGPMNELYDLHLTRNDIHQMDAGLVYATLKNRQVFFGLVYTTNGRLKDFKSRVLKSDEQYFPFYSTAPVVRKEVMQRHSEFVTLFDPTIERLDGATMQVLNAQVGTEQQTPQKVTADSPHEYHLLNDDQTGRGGNQ